MNKKLLTNPEGYIETTAFEMVENKRGKLVKKKIAKFNMTESEFIDWAMDILEESYDFKWIKS